MEKEDLLVFVTDYTVHESKPFLFGLTPDGRTVGVRVSHMPYAIYIERTFDADDENKTRDWFNDTIHPFLKAKDRFSKYFRPSLQLVHRHKLCGYAPTKIWIVKAIYDSAADAKRDAYAVQQHSTHHAAIALLPKRPRSSSRAVASSPPPAPTPRRRLTCKPGRPEISPCHYWRWCRRWGLSRRRRGRKQVSHRTDVPPWAGGRTQG